MTTSPPIIVPTPGTNDAATMADLHNQLAWLRQLVETRLDAMDRATDVLADNVNRVPTVLDREMSKVRELTEEKFQGIEKQFSERDVRTRAAELAAQTAVNAALQAQKEAAAAQNESNAAAITKSEAATVKQIDGILALLASNTKAIDEKFGAINGRLDRSEGKSGGTSASITMLIAVIGVVMAVLAVGLAFVNSTRITPSRVIESPTRTP
jgi:cobalamin biosynthesis Mg chelatase CobN